MVPKPSETGLPGERLLHSWKEIADYLNVTIRTAQRWREDGLPVRHLGAGRRPRVLASSIELDEWLSHQRQRTGIGRRAAADPTTGDGPHEPREPAAPVEPRRYSSRWLKVAAVGLGAVVLGVAGWAWRHEPLGPPDHAAVLGRSLVTYDSRGREIRRLELAGLNPDAYDPASALSRTSSTPAIHDATLVADIDENAHRETLLNVWPAANGDMPGGLICFNENGTVRWQLQLGRERRFGDRLLNGDYRGVFIRSFRAHGRPWVLTVSHHDYWFPAYLAIVDPATGEVHQEYWHPGWLKQVEIVDVDDDGQPEILAGGYNNPGGGLGRAGLVALEVSPTPQPPTADAPSNDVDAFAGPGVRAYALFPRSDICTALGDHPFVQRLDVVAGRRLTLRVVGAEDTVTIYDLDLGFHVLDFQVSDNFEAIHRQLEGRGLLDHRLTDAEVADMGRIQVFTYTPDGNSQALAAYWTLPH